MSCQTCLMALVEIRMFFLIAHACTKPIGAFHADAVCGTLSGHFYGESVAHTGHMYFSRWIRLPCSPVIPMVYLIK